MRDFEKLVAEGASKNRSHGLRYDLSISELLDLLESVTPDWNEHLSLVTPVMKALSRAYDAGMASGVRMAENDRKKSNSFQIRSTPTLTPNAIDQTEIEKTA